MWGIAETQNWTQHNVKQPQAVIIIKNLILPWTGISSFGWKLQGMHSQTSTKPLLRTCKTWFYKAYSLVKLSCFSESWRKKKKTKLYTSCIWTGTYIFWSLHNSNDSIYQKKKSLIFALFLLPSPHPPRQGKKKKTNIPSSWESAEANQLKSSSKLFRLI